MLVDQITPHLPKDNEEVNTHAKRLQAMLDATTVPDSVHNQEDGDQGYDGDHQESLRGDSASSITPWEERDQGHIRDHRDLCEIIHTRDARSRIKNQH
jgi:hypothetical protein